MKKIFYITCALTILFTSCKKDEPGGTAVQSMAGEWHVVADQVNSQQETVFEDLFGVGRFHFVTFNTASNGTDKMWISDLENYWEFQVKVDIDLNSLTFETKTPQTAYEGCEVTVKGGKIMLNAATTPSGMPADSIVCYISFSDDTYAEKYGYSYHKISGYRYTGFAEDE